jgi:hypothetical protein
MSFRKHTNITIRAQTVIQSKNESIVCTNCLLDGPDVYVRRSVLYHVAPEQSVAGSAVVVQFFTLNKMFDSTNQTHGLYLKKRG